MARQCINVFTILKKPSTLWNTVSSLTICTDQESMENVGDSFYTSPSGQVRTGGQLSKPFTLLRGVRQGSVLSPMLFLLVMDSLLTELQNTDAGVSINGIYTGSLGHADDLRSVIPTYKSKLTSCSPSLT